MPTIPVVLETPLPPERVLQAAHDFSERRAQVFPAVSVERLEVHVVEGSSADVTEGTPVGPFGVHWERCRYDWSQPGSVTASVTESNVYEPAGSRWEIRASANEAGSRVEMVWVREFKGSVRGRTFGTLFRLFGKPIFARYARDTLRNLEKLERLGTTAD
jgi:hypothetical protein